MKKYLFVLLCFLKFSPGFSQTQNLDKIIGDYTTTTKKLDAFWAPYFNVEEDLEKFGDYGSPDYFVRAKKTIQDSLQELSKINRATLTEKDQKTYDLFRTDLEISLKSFDYPSELIDLNQLYSRLKVYVEDSDPKLTSFPFDSVKHYQDFIKRANGFPVYIDHQIALLKKGVTKKIVLNCIIAEKTLSSLKDALEPDVEKHPFMRPTSVFPKEFSSQEKQNLNNAFRKMITEIILPNYTRFSHYFKNEYMPSCRKEYGIGSFPNGKAWYKHQILQSTNLALSPDQVHKMGLKEVARIVSELEVLKKKFGFKGSIKQFITAMKDDPKNYFKTKEEMFKAFEDVRERISHQIPKYFSLIPKTEYKIVEGSSPDEPSASYKSPTEMISYGRFVLNPSVRSNPIYGVTTLSLHEAVPGHHFQLALPFEMKDTLSEYQRKIYNSTSFVEGWALYAEYLGREMGVFNDPMQVFGNLSDEMLRAVRLVVDSGIHSLGWSRQKVINYMSEHLASDISDVETEADRYSVWPGQALAYKVGQLKIIELRKDAQKQLGDEFDIKEYHKIVLEEGTVSLPLLEVKVKKWIKSVQAKKAKI